MTMHYLIFLKGNVRWQMEVSYLLGILKKGASTSDRSRSLPGFLNFSFVTQLHGIKMPVLQPRQR